jgi:tripartite-type tricarboxylate transporter receptor subunit TctC
VALRRKIRPTRHTSIASGRHLNEDTTGGCQTGGDLSMRVSAFQLRLCVRNLFVLTAVAAMLAGMPRPAAAQAWPTRPVTVIMAFASGAMIDFVGLSLAKELTAVLGQPVVAEGRTGSGGVVAGGYVAKAAPDGYTLLLTAVGPAVLRPLIDKSVSYDTNADFTPIILIGESPNVLLANPKLGVNTVKDLLAYAKSKDNKITIGHAGPGTMGHLCSVVFAAKAGIDGNFIAYRGTAPMLTDLLGGQIDTGFPAYNPAVQSAKILAVTSDERVDFLPGVPTMKESGIDLVGATWFAIFGPARMPPEVVAKLNGAIDAFLKKPETKQRFSDVGFRVLGGPPARLTETVAQDRAKWSGIIADLKLEPEK